MSRKLIPSFIFFLSLHCLFSLGHAQDLKQDSETSEIDATTLSRQYITDKPWEGEFSERTVHAPFQKIKPQPLQITSPQFETLFQSSSAVQSRSQGSPTTSVRGSSQAARVLFLLDNLPLNFLDGFGGSSQFVPTEILEQVNIFEGPTSALYGANALGGSIHFVPSRKKETLLRLGWNNTSASPFSQSSGATTNAALVTPLIHQDRHFLQASAFIEKDNGAFPFTEPASTTQVRAHNQQKMSRFTLLGQHKHSRGKISHLLLFSDLQKTTPGPLYNPLITNQHSKAFLAGFTSELKTSDSTLWTSRMSYASLNSDFLDSSTSQSRSDKLWSSQILAWEISPGILSQTLFDIGHNNYSATFVQDQRYERTEPELAQTLIVPILSNLFVEPSVRHLFRYQKTLWQFNIPWVYNSYRAWFLYSEGFRPPSLTDLYAQTIYFQGNTHLQPESSRQYEVGNSWSPQTGWTLSASAFQLEYSNLLQSSILPSSQFTKINVGRARTTGANLKTEGIYQHWQWQATHTFMHAEDLTTGRPLRFSPRHQTFLKAAFAISENHSWSLQQTLWSPIWDLNPQTGQQIKLSGWESTDLIGTYQWKRWSLQGGVYNLFDRARQMNYGYPEPQRRIAMALEARF